MCAVSDSRTDIKATSNQLELMVEVVDCHTGYVANFPVDTLIDSVRESVMDSWSSLLAPTSPLTPFLTDGVLCGSL